MHALCGRFDEAQTILEDLITRPARQAPPAEIVGLVHASLGDRGSSIENGSTGQHGKAVMFSDFSMSPRFSTNFDHSRASLRCSACRVSPDVV